MASFNRHPHHVPLGTLRAVGAPIAFLTRIPLDAAGTFTAEDLARGAALFPLVGLAIGVLTGLVATATARGVPPLLAAALAVTFAVVLTGALHVDGLADTADGLGARSRERALAVMRESTLGAYGTIAIVLDLVVRVAAFDALLADHHVIVVATVAGGLSRAVPVALAALLPYARSETGLGDALSRAGGARAAVALAVAVGSAWLIGGAFGLEAALVTVVTLAAVFLHSRRWLGGYTGDTLGAASEVCELAIFVFALCVLGSR